MLLDAECREQSPTPSKGTQGTGCQRRLNNAGSAAVEPPTRHACVFMGAAVPLTCQVQQLLLQVVTLLLQPPHELVGLVRSLHRCIPQVHPLHAASGRHGLLKRPLIRPVPSILHVLRMASTEGPPGGVGCLPLPSTPGSTVLCACTWVRRTAAWRVHGGSCMRPHACVVLL